MQVLSSLAKEELALIFFVTRINGNKKVMVMVEERRETNVKRRGLLRPPISIDYCIV